MRLFPSGEAILGQMFNRGQSFLILDKTGAHLTLPLFQLRETIHSILQLKRRELFLFGVLNLICSFYFQLIEVWPWFLMIYLTKTSKIISSVCFTFCWVYLYSLIVKFVGLPYFITDLYLYWIIISISVVPLRWNSGCIMHVHMFKKQERWQSSYCAIQYKYHLWLLPGYFMVPFRCFSSWAMFR